MTTRLHDWRRSFRTSARYMGRPLYFYIDVMRSWEERRTA